MATDINDDGWMDLFVANDTVPNFLWVNRQGKFKDEGVEAGVAYSADGRARSGMGVDAADLDQDESAGPERDQRRSGDVLRLPQ